MIRTLATTNYLQSENSINAQISKEIFVLSENFGAEGGAGNVHEIFPELHRVIPGSDKNQNINKHMNYGLLINLSSLTHGL